MAKSLGLRQQLRNAQEALGRAQLRFEDAERQWAAAMEATAVIAVNDALERAKTAMHPMLRDMLSRGRAVELIEQVRLDIIRERAAHKLGGETRS